MSETANFKEVLGAIERYRHRLASVVVHLNDTYLLEERPGAGLPGFPRVIATVKRLRDHVQKVTDEVDRFLVVHSGDFLGPSRVGKKNRGRAMVHLLNELGLTYCVIGNHEFDYKAFELADRLNEAKFATLLSNVTDPSGRIRPKAVALWPSDTNPVVALTGIVSKRVAKSSKNNDGIPWAFKPSRTLLKRFVKETANVPFRLVLTHATRSEDLKIRDELPDTSRTYLLGGHDHDIDWIETDDPRFVMKNLSNCQSVRVILLLAGGEPVINDLLWKCEAIRTKRLTNGLSEEDAILRYPADLEAVLANAHPIDRQAVRQQMRLLDEEASREHASDPTDPSTITTTRGAGDDEHSDSLSERLTAVHRRRDVLTWKLVREDHEEGTKEHVDYVDNVLKEVEEPNDGQLVCDFSSEAQGGLEARDECLRRLPTDFGVFAAECVRSASNADIAILNAGSFRSDNLLPAKLRVGDLRETFLYDKKNSIIVLPLDTTWVDALLAHGRKRNRMGTGAFPQSSDRRVKGAVTARLAISSYLLIDPDSIDEYELVLAGKLNVTPDKAREWAKHKQESALSIVSAIKECGPTTPYPKLGGALRSADLATRLVGLLLEYRNAFDKKVEVVIAVDDQEPQSARDEKFRSWLGSDAPLEHQEVERPRDEIRALLRALPAVSRYQKHTEHNNQSENAGSKRGSQSWVRLWTKAESQLRSLHAQVMTHPFASRDKTDYAQMYAVAASGIPGWD